jgi:sugar phosphate isomerase/epimerase
MKQLQAGASLCFKEFSLTEALRGIAEAGFEYVEIGAVKGWVEHLDPDGETSELIREARVALDQFGLTATSLSGHSQLHTDVGRERLRRLVHVAAGIGATVVNTYTGDAATAEERQSFVENTREVADEAGKEGLLLCIETDSNLMPTAEIGTRLLEEISNPAVRMNYDTGNVIYYAGAQPEEDIEYALSVLGHVHLKDKRGGIGVFDFPPLGEGEIDIERIITRLKEVSFIGPVAMEIEFNGTWPDWQGCLEAASRGKRYWDSVVARVYDGGEAGLTG